MRVTKELLVKIIQEELDEIQGDMKFRQPGGTDTDALVKKMQDKEDSQKNFDPLQGFKFNKNDNLVKKLNTVNGLVEELLTTNDKKLVNMMKERLKSLFKMLDGVEKEAAMLVYKQRVAAHPEKNQMDLPIK